MSLSQATQLSSESQDINLNSQPYLTPAKVAAYGAAVLSLAFGSYELSNILYPSPEAMNALSNADVRTVLYTATGSSLVGGFGYFLKEGISVARKVLRRY